MNPLHQPQAQQAGQIWLEKLLAYARSPRARPCYAAYSPEVLRDYLTFHLAQGTLRWVKHPHTREVCALGVAWRLCESLIHLRATARRPIFDWQPDDPWGDCLFIADVAADDAAALRSLITALPERFDTFPRLKLYTYRHGQLRQLCRPALVKLFERKV